LPDTEARIFLKEVNKYTPTGRTVEVEVEG
jgi:hypothetical protein